MTAGETLYRVVTFEGVNVAEDATYKLGQISVGTEDFAYWNLDYIATVNPYGGQDKYYTWDPDAAEGAGSWYECDENVTIDYDKPANDVDLPMNRGVIIFSGNGANLTFSGAVIAGDSALYCAAGETTYTGNFTPSTLTLGDIVVGDEDFAYWNLDYIATINPYGGQDLYYTWDPDAAEGAGSWYECDENITIDYDKPANNVEFEPNMGFLLFTGNGATLNIPSPL